MSRYAELERLLKNYNESSPLKVPDLAIEVARGRLDLDNFATLVEAVSIAIRESWAELVEADSKYRHSRGLGSLSVAEGDGCGLYSLVHVYQAVRIAAELTCSPLVSSVRDAMFAQIYGWDRYEDAPRATIKPDMRSPSTKDQYLTALAWLAQKGVLSPYTTAAVLVKLRRAGYPPGHTRVIERRLRVVVDFEVNRALSRYNENVATYLSYPETEWLPDAVAWSWMEMATLALADRLLRGDPTPLRATYLEWPWPNVHIQWAVEGHPRFGDVDDALREFDAAAAPAVSTPVAP